MWPCRSTGPEETGLPPAVSLHTNHRFVMGTSAGSCCVTALDPLLPAAR
eukprot:CAMPEP_0180031504 /NCGR_PEP_ID=MMETSP0984-20121128/27952_1 /TAXON_ID=483367 /ORGANISM="non described non described, Strain CCMP 2436" /LENGTH=48 /DNA_ID= /DNA_START= /DNA_END= /DNA_ORIENTATION=